MLIKNHKQAPLKERMMGLYKWLGGIVIGSFVAGVSVILFLDDRIETKVNERLIDINQQLSNITSEISSIKPQVEISGNELTRIIWERPKILYAINSNHNKKSSSLGEHDICFINKIHSQISNGTTICDLEVVNRSWTLHATGSTIPGDRSKRGNVICSAICGSVQK